MPLDSTFLLLRKVSFWEPLVLASLLLSACGGESLNAMNGNGANIVETSVSEFDDLPNCSKKREGMSMMTEKDGMFICTDGTWEKASKISSYDSEDDIPNCTSKREGLKVFVREIADTLTCVEGVWEENVQEGEDSSGSNSEKDFSSDSETDSSDSKKRSSSSESEENPEYSGSSRSSASASAKRAVITCYAMPGLADTGESIKWSFANTAPSIAITSYEWIFDDGTVSSEMNPQKVYNVAGFYEATLMVNKGTSTESLLTECSGVTVNKPASSSSSVGSSSNAAACDEGARISLAMSSSSMDYICENGEWVVYYDPEKNYCEGVVYNSSTQMCDTRDGRVYSIVTIGSEGYAQTWMAENLNYRYRGRTRSLDSSSFCFGNVLANCEANGRLYLWSAAVDSAGIIKDNVANDCGYGVACSLPSVVSGVCPSGWHLPTEDEWNQLFSNVGGQSTAGAALKSTTGWANGGNGSVASGFSALPAGYMYDDGEFHSIDENAFFWSASVPDNNNAYYMSLFYGYLSANLDYNSKNFAMSVRCIRDDS